MTQYFNHSDDKPRRQAARGNMPDAEVMLWSVLKSRKMMGCKFRRQYGVGAYQLDFYCAELRLGIELDGETHYVGTAQEQDRRRQEFIEPLGIRVLRFVNSDVYENLEGVWEAIARAVREQIEQSGPDVLRGRRSKRDWKRDLNSDATPLSPLPKGGNNALGCASRSLCAGKYEIYVAPR
jgi:very-short-patch-repair endonuclease